ncbi:hypothetical protein B0H14DRAFT_3756839 [Mycena olivaceomarginata]|nr:hypothetical protein B0H14DRAFT_3756839 [Mycena olivaceomarginata]
MNHQSPGTAFRFSKTGKVVKTTWGGQRAGSGRKPRNAIRTRDGDTYSPSVPASLNLRPAAWFQRRDTHQPNPQGPVVPEEQPNLFPPSDVAQSTASGSAVLISSQNDPGSVSRVALNIFNTQLAFVERNNEHGHIASGFSRINDSLVDELINSNGNDFQAAQSDTESEPSPESLLHQYLSSVKKRIKKQIKKHGQPACYKRGDFFDRAKHPVFALAQAATLDFSPNSLYECDVFVWLPHLLPGHPDKFKCSCGLHLSRHGFNDNPIARRVRRLPDDYFLLTNRFFKTCGPFAILPAVSELQRRHHARIELMYYSAAIHFGLHGKDQIPQFSAFANPAGYAGCPPSTGYFKAMFADWIGAHRITWTVLKPPFPLILQRLIILLMVEKIWKAAYSVANQFEETPHNRNKDFMKQLLHHSHRIDSMRMEEAASEILEEAALTSQGNVYLLGLVLKFRNASASAPKPKLDVVQLRTKTRILVFKIRQSLLAIAECLSLSDLRDAVESATDPPFIDLGHYARLTGVVEDPNTSLHALVGSVLQKSYHSPTSEPYLWSSALSTSAISSLYTEADCIWQLWLALSSQEAVGLRLQPHQAKKHGQLVTLVQSCKPIARGFVTMKVKPVEPTLLPVAP